MPIIAGELVPGGGGFAAVDDVYVAGAIKQVANLTARNAIAASRRKAGMRAYDISTDKEYILLGGITDGNWVEIVRIGTASPEGSVVGCFAGQTYAQVSTVGDGSMLQRLWVFNGLVNTNTGWV